MPKENLRIPVTNSFIPDILRKNEELWSMDKTSEFQQQLEAWTISVRQRLSQLRGDSSKSPDCSVIVPTCDEEKYILMLLESVAQQNSRYSIEVIIVDNNSSDSDTTSQIAFATGAVVFKYNKQTPCPVPFARTVGLHYARGMYICATDADCVLGPNWVETMVNVLEHDMKVTCVTGDVMHYDASDSLYFYATANIVTRRIGNLLRTSHASGQNMVFRRNDAINVGGYDLNEPVSDDRSLCKRLQTIGEKYLVRSHDATVYASARRVKEEGILRSRFLAQFGLSSDGYLTQTGELKKPR